MDDLEEEAPERIILRPDEIVSVEDVCRVADGEARVSLSEDEDYRMQLRQAAQNLKEMWQNEEEIYGVTTGLGESCTVNVSGEQIEDLPRNLTRFHGCGMGEFLDERSARATLFVRLVSLTDPASAVRPEVLERLVTLLNRDIVPRIPEEGSVGASGDLTPLSYIAAVVLGEREVIVDGKVQSTEEVYEREGLEPIELRPKEALSLMNGTSMMTGLGCLAFSRARYLSRLCARVTSFVVVGLKGNPDHYDERLFELKPHPGQSRVARWIRSDLEIDRSSNEGDRLQERYSLRCAPHIIGVLEDALPWARDQLETEMNSSNDNPLMDPETGDMLHGGNFYGGHVAFVMDSLKNAIGQLSDLLDRQLGHLVDSKVNRHLPSNLTGSTGDDRAVNHGFKAVQIGTSSWAAEALNQSTPTGSFSRSTESHNQDKVSMGSIAARDCLRVLDLTEQVAAASLLAAAQALDCRAREDDFSIADCSAPVQKTYTKVRDVAEFLESDRPMESELRKLTRMIKRQEFKLYKECTTP